MTSQMPWWEASLWFCLLPLACLLFRWFARGPMAYTLHNSHTLRVGIAVASLILVGGFVSAGHALRHLLSYTRVEAEGLRRVRFLQPEKYQRWDELISAKIQQMEVLEKGGGAPHQRLDVTFEFKEGGRWREQLTLSSDEFPQEEFKRFEDWMHASLNFVPSKPPPIPLSPL